MDYLLYTVLSVWRETLKAETWHLLSIIHELMCSGLDSGPGTRTSQVHVLWSSRPDYNNKVCHCVYSDSVVYHNLLTHCLHVIDMTLVCTPGKMWYCLINALINKTSVLFYRTNSIFHIKVSVCYSDNITVTLTAGASTEPFGIMLWLRVEHNTRDRCKQAIIIKGVCSPQIPLFYRETSGWFIFVRNLSRRSFLQLLLCSYNRKASPHMATWQRLSAVSVIMRMWGTQKKKKKTDARKVPE